MNIKSLVLTGALCLSSLPAHAGDWVAPFLGGAILGNLLSAPYPYTRPVYVPPPVYVQPAPVVISPGWNPYVRYCSRQPMYDQWGRYLGLQTICN